MPAVPLAEFLDGALAPRRILEWVGISISSQSLEIPAMAAQKYQKVPKKNVPELGLEPRPMS